MSFYSLGTELVARDDGGFQRLAGTDLVSVHLRDVEGAVSGLDARPDCSSRRVAGRREDAEIALEV